MSRMPARALSVIIVSWNTEHLLRRCIASIHEHLPAGHFEVVVVDNASTDGTCEMLASQFPSVRLIRNEHNSGFGAANNQGMRDASGDWFLLLNSDTELTDDSVAQLLDRVMTQSDIGVAQCRLRFPDGRTQYSAHRFHGLGLVVFEALGLYKLTPRRTPDLLLGGYWDHEEERDVDWVIGAFMLLPRRVFEETGGFDEKLFMYGEDREWCYRIRQQGWRIRYYPQASIMHVGHGSSDEQMSARRLALCLTADRDFFVERIGPARAKLAMTVLMVGAAMRTAYYGARIKLGGPRADAYRSMQPEVIATLRILREIVTRGEAAA